MRSRDADPSVAAFTARRAERARAHRARVRERRQPPAAPEPSTVDSTPRVEPAPRRGRRRLAGGALAMVGCLGLSGCGLSDGIYGLPLPGGPDLGDNPITLHVRMADVYDLVPQASVKLNDVPVGKVTDIDLANKQHGRWQADVTVEANRKRVKLPATGVTARLRQTSLLGEKYVELVRPKGPQSGRLASGAIVPEDPGYTHVQVEQVLGALSLLLNEGGLPQIRTISREISTALSGREGDVRGLLQNVNTLVGTLDEQSSSITRALDGVNRLSATLDGQKDRLAGAIDDLPQGLKVLRDQRGQLVDTLQALQRLSGVAIDTVNRTRDDLIANLKAIRPTLKQFGDNADNIADSLPILVTIPFGDYSTKAFRGDYANLFAKLDLNFGTLIQNLGRSRQNFLGQLGVLPPQLGGLVGGKPSQPGQPDAGTGSGSTDPREQRRIPQRQQQQSPLLTPLLGGGDGGGDGVSGVFNGLLGGGS